MRMLGILLTIACLSQTGARLVPDASVEAPVSGQTLRSVLPEATIAAIELRDVARRWEEIRSLESLAVIQDSWLEVIGLDPGSVPRLTGDGALLALVADEDGRSILPVALLDPPDVAEAIALLDGMNGDADRVAVVRRGEVIWVGPSKTGERLTELADGPRIGAPRFDELAELDRRLPTGGLARGWIEPERLAGLLRDQAPGTRPLLLEVVHGLLAAELDMIRVAGFRRDLVGASVVTEAVVVYDTATLPPAVETALGSAMTPSVLPQGLPPGVVAMLAFRPEPDASLAWMRHAAISDPRGPLRNLDFWLDELESRSGVDVERDLLGSIGERGWLFVLEGEPPGTLEAAVVVEAVDESQLERALFGSRSWLIEQAWGRSLGFAIPTPSETALGESVIHGLSLWTPFGETPGPAFVVTDGHLVAGTDVWALRRGLGLLGAKSNWRPTVHAEGVPADESMRVDAAALASLVEGMIARVRPEHRASMTTEVGALLSNLDTAQLGVWYERDAVRLRGRLRFRGTENP